MIFPTKSKLHLAASADISRVSVNAILYDLQNKRCVATDSHIMAVVPVEPEEGDVGGLIDPKAVKAACAVKARTNKARLVRGEAETTVHDPYGLKTSFQNPNEVRFPQYEAVLPPSGKGSVKLPIDAALLLKLAQALGSKGPIYLEFSPDEDGKVTSAIRAETDDGNFGVIMPRR